MDTHLTYAETLSREPRKWLMTMAIVLICLFLLAWSASAMQSNSTGGSGLSVAKGIVSGILHPTPSLLLTLGDDGVPYLLFETMAIAKTDVIFDGVDLSGADFSECLLSNVSFKSSKLTGIHLSRCRIKKLIIEGCVCRYSSFDESAMADSRFSSSDFSSSSFSNMKISSSSILQSELSFSSFIRTGLASLDLSDSIIDGIALSEDLSEIRGAKLSFDQAITLIRGKGAVIAE